jgi:DNA-binding CsgD family transcriptional regulator
MELRIVEHLAGGASTPDIAAALLMSRSTVQTHITHVMTKLGVNSRVQIAREALLRNPPSDVDIHV